LETPHCAQIETNAFTKIENLDTLSKRKLEEGWGLPFMKIPAANANWSVLQKHLRKRLLKMF
jgi:hypothetical protein